MISNILEKSSLMNFFYDDLDDSELDNLLNMVDDIHIRFLTEQMPDNQKTIDDFRHFVFKLIKQKIIVLGVSPEIDY